jgi:hypothetical protein
MNRLNAIISQYFDNYEIQETSEPKTYSRSEIQLPDGGSVSIGLEDKTRVCAEFLHFNIRNSELRLKDSNAWNGKINVFGDDCLPKLHGYLNELKNILK